MNLSKVKYLAFVGLLTGFTACVGGTDETYATETNEAIENPKQPLADTDTENEQSLPADTTVVADDFANLDNPPNPENVTTVGGSVTTPAPDQEQRLDQYYARFSDSDKVGEGQDGTPVDDDASDDDNSDPNEVSYLYEYDDTPAPKGKAGDYDITYYKNDGEFYKATSTLSSSNVDGEKSYSNESNPTKLVNGKRVPIEKMGDTTTDNE